MGAQVSASILIPNYNGKELLRECLPSVVEAVKEDSGNHEIIVIDDGSTDGSISFLRKHFPDVKIVELKENQRLAKALNAGLAAARQEIVVIPNTDMLVNEYFLQGLLRHFKCAQAEKLFAVHPKHLKWDRTTIDGGKRQAVIYFGIFEPFGEHDREKDSGQIDIISPVLTVENGAYRKKILLELGGFDPLFPSFQMFIDVCYRAWKKGYFLVFDPRSVLYHKEHATYSRVFSRRQIEFYQIKEKLIFMWKNFTDLSLLIEHVFFLPVYVLLHVFAKGDLTALKSFVSASREIPKIIKWRIQDHSYLRSDKEVFRLLNLPFRVMRIPKKLLK